MKKSGQRSKVLIFTFACIIGLMYLTFGTGKLHVGRQGYNIYVIFDDVAGIEKNAPVMLNGLEVGRVEEISVSYDEDRTKNVLKVLLKKDIQVWDNPVVSIKTLGLMGEKFVQISSFEGKRFLKPGEYVKGKPFMDLDVLMEKAEGLTEELKKLSVNVNDAVEDNRGGIDQIVKNLEAASKNLEEFTEDLKRNPWKLLYKSKGAK